MAETPTIIFFKKVDIHLRIEHSSYTYQDQKNNLCSCFVCLAHIQATVTEIKGD